MHTRSTRRIGAAWVLTFALIGPAAADERPHVTLHAIALRALGPTDLGIGLLEARRLTTPHLLLSAGPAVVHPDGADTLLQLRASATVLVQLGRVRLDDRNSWVVGDGRPQQYRNRLRLTAPLHVRAKTLRLQVTNELVYEREGRGWFRHTAGAGVGLDLTASLSLDTYWLRQDDDRRAEASMFVLMLTARLR